MPDASISAIDRLKARSIAAIASPFVAMLGRTLTWRSEGDQYLDDLVKTGRQPIFAFWHGRIFGGLYYFRNRNIVVITSRNFDGEWIAGIITRFGFGTARGSTSRGGARALVQLRRDLADGRPVAFTLDGPRGPARVAQPGAVWLAGATGHPILPFHVEASRFWEAPSWDRTQLPKPFTTIAIAIGRPITVPNTSETAVEEKRHELEATLTMLESRAQALVTGVPR
jgi:lysophospholipid acyltransferase (LPLAT)-like uncharacterized protein